MMSDKPLPTDLELTALDPIFREHPHDRLDRLRTEDPVYLDAALGRLFLTRFEDIRAVLADRSLSRDPRKAPDTPRRRALMGDMPPEAFQPSMLSLDDPDHKRLRGLVSQAFNQRWSDAWAQIFNPVRSPEQTVELRAAGQGLNDYFARAIDTRRGRCGDDLISMLVAAEEAGDHLSVREIVVTCNLLLVAGNLTTTDLIGNGVLALLRHPDQLAKLCAHPELMPNAVEEMLRYDPPVVQTGRFPLEPREIGGRKVHAGQAMICSLLAAGHDPAQHSNPHGFDVERVDTTHLAFGGGAHYCLGAPLARAEAQIAIAALFERFPGLRLDPQHAVKHKRAPAFNGLEALWVHAA